MPNQHPCFQKIVHFQGIRLNAQWRIYSTAGHANLNGQSRPCPHRKVFHSPQSSRTRGRRKNPLAPKGSPGTLTHNRKFTLATEILIQITLSKKLTNQSCRFTLGRNWIGNRSSSAGTLDGGTNPFTPCQKARCLRCLIKYIVYIRVGLAFLVFLT